MYVAGETVNLDEPKGEDRKLSVRVKKYREARLQGMTKRCAMIAAGYSLKQVGLRCSRTDKLAFAEVLEVAGATDRNIARVMNEQMSAVKPVIYNGEIVDWYPDNDARRKAAELAAVYKLTPRENGDKPDTVVNYYSAIPKAKIESEILINEVGTNRMIEHVNAQ